VRLQGVQQAAHYMLAGRAGRRIAGLGQHSTDLQHAPSGLPQYGVVQLGGQLQCNCSTVPALWTTRQARLHCTTAQQHDAMLLTECGGAGNKTRRTHAVEDIYATPGHWHPTAYGFTYPGTPVGPWGSL
jgi:hypothetical protein